MKKLSMFLIGSLAAASALGAEFNYLKAFCKGYPSTAGVTFSSKVANGSRTLTFKVAPGEAMASVYTYADVKPGEKLSLSFLYKVANLKEGNRPGAKIQINFKTPDGKKSVGTHIHNLQLKNSEKYQPAATIFTVPEGAGKIQMVFIYLTRTSGDFEITNVKLNTASDKLPEELKSAYDRNKAYWSTWPRNESIKVTRTADRRKVTFSSKLPGDNAAVYTYCTLQKFVTYNVSFKITSTDLVSQPGGNAICTLDFQTAKGKPSGDAAVQWKLELPAKGQSKEYNFEFTAPEKAESARVHLMKLKGIGGTFVIEDLAIEPVIDAVKVAKATAPIKLDGKLDEAVWSECTPIKTFYRFGTDQRQEAESVMYMAYDDKNLYLAVRCYEPFMDKLVAKETKHDSPVWCDDSVEFFVASPNNRAMQLIFNTVGGKFDSELAQRVPGDPWRGRGEFNCQWQAKAALEKDCWTGELVLPFKEFNIAPKAGQKWRINLVRNRRVPGVTRGSAQWNLQSGDLKNVDKFATLEFTDDFGVLTRYRELMLDDPLKVERKVERFAELPRKKDGRYKVFGVGAYLIHSYSGKFQKEHGPTWHLRQKQMLEEMADAADATPVGYPWLNLIGVGGKEEILALLKKNNWKFACNLHNSGQDRQAIKEGAVLKVRANLVNAADPLLHKITMAWGHERFQRDAWIIPHLAWVVSTDEPTNTIYEAFSVTKNTGNVAALNKISDEIKAKYGYGKYGLFDNFAANDDFDAPFRRIAFLTYWNEKVIGFKAKERDLVKHYAPNAPFMAVNAFNTVSTFRGIEVFPDFAKVSDIGCVDPYPTSTLAQCGRERALYHTGFSAKMLDDMNADKLTAVYAQAFNYCGRAPVPENLREWASQALKNGADILRWYTDGNQETAPGCYEEVIRISRIVRKMQPLALPEKSKVAILYSYIAQWGKFDIEQNAEYSLYVILGEQLHSYFKFVSDVEIDDNRAKAGDYNTIIAPNLKYLDKITAAKLVEFVEKGGRLIVLDPEAFAYARDGSSLQSVRSKLIGNGQPAKKSAKNILLNGKEASVEVAFATTVPQGAKVIASYADKTPAAFERKVGKGSVVYFAATPFTSARITARPGEWSNYLASEMKKAGEHFDYKHWDFMIPKAEKK